MSKQTRFLLVTLAILVMLSSSAMALYDFGGMYGYGYYGSYPNPATGDYSCPANYSSSQVLGTPNIDYPYYFCYRNFTGSGLYDFGGMYGGGYYQNYPNPATGAMSCPAGYNASQVRGTVNLDYRIYFCYKSYTGNGTYELGGLYGGGYYQNYPNPATGAMSCQTNYTSSQVSGTPNLDYQSFFCYK